MLSIKSFGARLLRVAGPALTRGERHGAADAEDGTCPCGVSADHVHGCGALHSFPPLCGWYAEVLLEGGVLTREDRHARAALDQLL